MRTKFRHHYQNIHLKRLLDTSKKRVCYEQLDGVGMGGLANM